MTALEDDDREALADILMSDAVMFSDTIGRDYVYTEAAAILAAGFRRLGPANSSEIDATGISPITDAQVEAAAESLYANIIGGVPARESAVRRYQGVARAALEAARDAS